MVTDGAAGAHGRAPLPLGAGLVTARSFGTNIAGVYCARPRLRMLPAVAPVVVGSVAANTAAASDGLPAAEQDRTKPRIDSHGCSQIMRNPGMLGSYSVQGMELAMHCLFSLDYFQRHERHSLRYSQIPKRLKEAGFTEQQAEALADAEAEFIEQNLATKRDIVTSSEILSSGILPTSSEI